eukprot:6480509-Amphidinium_carterae.1
MQPLSKESLELALSSLATRLSHQSPWSPNAVAGKVIVTSAVPPRDHLRFGRGPYQVTPYCWQSAQVCDYICEKQQFLAKRSVIVCSCHGIKSEPNKVGNCSASGPDCRRSKVGQA